MTRVILAGGGTAGHVNPLLAVAEELVASGISTPEEILVVGTATGLEARLVPEAGYELATTARLPFPRRANLEAVAFWPRFGIAVLGVVRVIRRHRPDVIAGFGGFASAPSYVAAWLTGTPLVIHEANAVPGFANRLGARLTRYVVTTFSRTRLPHARLLGMPMARRITAPKPSLSASAARSHFGLRPKKPTLLVTGGSQGSVTLNSTIQSVAGDILALGWQILHIVGGKNPVPENRPEGYHALAYCDDMDKALACATLIVSRAGAATVSEIQLLGVPAIFVPYPVGNGEQEKNAEDSLRASAAVLVLDRQFTPDYVRSMVLPLLADDAAIRRMADNAGGLGRPHAAPAFVAVMMEALAASQEARGKK
jgi:UDP-N-acetylglucosamine--N-acetylmuramyl-(pentapeptide) pyrophosphoryl-undecaprenol N-acetylglucosamine transferase